MHQRALRKVLLIQAIEETDRNGEALPLAERTEATRSVIGNNPPSVETQAQAPLSSATEWFLIRRADALVGALRARSPGIDHVLDVAGGATSLDRGMLVLAFVFGAILSFFDGARGGINIFAAPLVVLLVWNLLVYILLGMRYSKSRIESTAAGANNSVTVGVAGPVPGRAGSMPPGAVSSGTGGAAGSVPPGTVGSRSAADPGSVQPGAIGSRSVGAAGSVSAGAVGSRTAGVSGSVPPGVAGSAAGRGSGSANGRAVGSPPDGVGVPLTALTGPTAVGLRLVGPSWFGRFYARWVRRRIDKLLGHSTRFNAPLAPGLRRFATDWWDLAQPLFFVRARRLLHLCAVFAALGLMAAYYLRAFVLRSAAGWEGGGAIGSQAAHALLTVLYAPASLLLGTYIPAADDIEKLRWSAPSLSGVGEPAIWVHLIALTAGLYIILPRLILTVLSAFRLWRLSRNLTLPLGVVGYVRTLVAAARSGS